MLDIPRLILLGIVLGIASYHDVRHREIPDYIWIVGGGAGAVLYVFDWHEVDLFVIFTMGVGGAIALLIWKMFPMGEADVLGIITASVVYPVSHDVVMVPVTIFFGGLILEHITAFFYNIRYNLEDVIRGKKIFCKVTCSHGIITKIMAFYSVHKRRGHEKFTFCAEEHTTNKNGTCKRRLSLRTPSPDSDFETRTGVFVSWAMPAFPFMLISFVLCVTLTIIFI